MSGPQIEIRPLLDDDYAKVYQIDVSETGDTVHKWTLDGIVPVKLDWRRPRWDRARCEANISEWRQVAAAGGSVLGAFDGARLVGEAVLVPRLTERMAQLSSLHMSEGYRRHGISRRLVQEIIRLARESGAKQLYVSATPSVSALGFYRSMGFVPTDEPHPALFELEPEDIHMIMDL